MMMNKKENRELSSLVSSQFDRITFTKKYRANRIDIVSDVNYKYEQRKLKSTHTQSQHLNTFEHDTRKKL